MAITVDIQYVTRSKKVPRRTQILDWATCCLRGLKRHAELTIRIVSKPEGQYLNRKWRNQDYATNVLSFPAGATPLAPEYLGDIVICAVIVNREAALQGKDTNAHWAHMIIHGILHLLEYDHINRDDARIMETLEIKKLKSLGFPDPYKR